MSGLLGLLFGRRGERLSPREAAARLPHGAVLVDVREPGEFAGGHAPGARLLPLGRIRADGAAAIDSLGLPDGTQEILLICHSGMRSRLAQAALAKDARYRYIDVAGGMNAWVASGLALAAPRR